MLLSVLNYCGMAVFAATGALVAVLLGIPALRIKGPFLAVVTLAFAVVLDGEIRKESR